MEFKCTNINCNLIFTTGKVKYVFDNTQQKLVHNITCPSCKSFTEDITVSDGFGNPKRSYKNVSKNYFNRGPKRKIGSERIVN